MHIFIKKHDKNIYCTNGTGKTIKKMGYEKNNQVPRIAQKAFWLNSIGVLSKKYKQAAAGLRKRKRLAKHVKLKQTIKN